MGLGRTCFNPYNPVSSRRRPTKLPKRGLTAERDRRSVLFPVRLQAIHNRTQMSRGALNLGRARMIREAEGSGPTSIWLVGGHAG